MRSAEAVKHMQEGNATLQSCGLRDQCKVHHFLDRIREQHSPARRSRGHYIAVIAKDRKRVGGDCARGDMKYGAGLLAGNLEHVGNHQKQALAGGESRRQRAGLQTAMNGSGGAAFGLQLAHDRGHAPNVLLIFRGPFVRLFTHGRRRRDRINRDYFICFVRDMGSGFVAIDGDHAVGHFFKIAPCSIRSVSEARP